MKKSILILVVMALQLSSCSDDNIYTGEGNIITSEISLDDFSAIRSLGSFNVNISKGAIQKVEVTGHSNIIDRLERKVVNGNWQIRLKEGNYINADLQINIVIPTLNKTILEGSGDINIGSFTSGNEVLLGILGSGDIDIDGNQGCKFLNVVIEGSGNIKTHGEFSDLEDLALKIIGSGNFDGFSIQVLSCEVAIVGSGSSSVHAIDELKVNIDGSSNVYYQGFPTIQSSISGSGQLINSNPNF